MQRRHLFGAAAASVTLAVTLGIAATGPRAHAQGPQSKRPNVLVLETDDQTLAEMEVLPNVRRLIGDEGVTFYYNYTLNENGVLHTYCAAPQPSCYQTDVYRDKADGIIRERAGKGPWFMWVAFLANHSGGPREADDPRGQATPVPAPRHKNKLAGTPVPQ